MCGREELGSLTRGFGPWVTATASLLKVAVDRAQEEKARVFPVPKGRGTQGWNGSAWVAEPCQDSQRGRVRDALSCGSHCPRPRPDIADRDGKAGPLQRDRLFSFSLPVSFPPLRRNRMSFCFL